MLRALSLGGEVDGVRLLSPETIDLVFDEQADGVDLVLGARSGSASATACERRHVPYVPAGRTFFWGGWGGSMIIMDLDRRLTISYMMNRWRPGILGSDRAESYVRAVYDAVG